jgi:magnesium transporter
VSQNFAVAEISMHLAEPESVVWLDLCRPTAADFEMINAEFGLHELAVEDALQESQRPKLDRYATHLFISAYAVAGGPAGRSAEDKRDRRVPHR